ncbi:MAG: hypothetical protein M1522_07735 [Actinobacteria bacterium]|nr:hypothetical protein [Actinomycetota bacterium]
MESPATLDSQSIVFVEALLAEHPPGEAFAGAVEATSDEGVLIGHALVAVGQDEAAVLNLADGGSGNEVVCSPTGATVAISDDTGWCCALSSILRVLARVSTQVATAHRTRRMQAALPRESVHHDNGAGFT